MEIKTKYNIGDRVYFIKDRRIDFGTILRINTLSVQDYSKPTFSVHHRITYDIKDIGELEEKYLFNTKEALKESL